VAIEGDALSDDPEVLAPCPGAAGVLNPPLGAWPRAVSTLVNISKLEVKANTPADFALVHDVFMLRIFKAGRAPSGKLYGFICRVIDANDCTCGRLEATEERANALRFDYLFCVLIGRKMLKQVPCRTPLLLRSRMDPPCLLIIPWLTQSPSPVPFWPLVV
jgi:hypothetical protein